MSTYKVELNWTPSPSAGVTGYRVYWGLGDGDLPSAQTTTTTNITMKVSAQPGDTLYFAVTALDASTGLESAFSAKATIVAPLPPEVKVATKPLPPTGLTVASITYVA